MKRHTLRLTAIIGLLITFAISSVYAGSGSGFNIFKRKKGVEPFTNALYEEDCGSCHFAYQPGWLPARSWQKMMSPTALEDHFEENAELDEDERLELLHFLTANAADKSSYKRSRKIMHSIKKTETPIRITATRYIRRKHDEIPKRMIEGNDKVRSLSYCEHCHTGADKGVFDDDTVVIPNYGRWDD